MPIPCSTVNNCHCAVFFCVLLSFAIEPFRSVPCAEGPALEILDRAVEWAEEYNLEVGSPWMCRDMTGLTLSPFPSKMLFPASCSSSCCSSSSFFSQPDYVLPCLLQFQSSVCRFSRSGRSGSSGRSGRCCSTSTAAQVVKAAHLTTLRLSAEPQFAGRCRRASVTLVYSQARSRCSVRPATATRIEVGRTLKGFRRTLGDFPNKAEPHRHSWS